MADIEEQLAELKQQLADERESRAAVERAAAERAATAERAAAVRAEEQQRQHAQTMQLLTQFMGKQGGGAEEQKNRGGETQEASVTGGEVENPAPSAPQDEAAAKSVVSVEADLYEDQSSVSGQDGDLGLQGESARATGGRRFRAP